jgi:hypothetical protein
MFIITTRSIKSLLKQVTFVIPVDSKLNVALK